MSELFQGAELEKILKANNQVHSASSDSNSGVQALLNYTTVYFPTLKVVIICDTNITVTTYAHVLTDTHTHLCPGV